jgi:hypothetical protein
VVEEPLILVQDAGVLDIPKESNASTFSGLKVISQTIYVLSLLDFFYHVACRVPPLIPLQSQTHFRPSSL